MITSVVPVVIIVVVAVATLAIFALVFVKRKRAALLQHEYDYAIPQLPKGIQDQQQNAIQMHLILFH